MRKLAVLLEERCSPKTRGERQNRLCMPRFGRETQNHEAALEASPNVRRGPEGANPDQKEAGGQLQEEPGG